MNKMVIAKWYGLLLVLLCISITALSQGYDTTKFRFSNPKPLGFTIMDIDFADNNNVMAVGSDGGVAISRDAGATWTYGALSYQTMAGYIHKCTLLDVSYVTPSVAYVVGTGSTNAGSVYLGGMLSKTVDGGKTWTLVDNPLYKNMKTINTVWFINKDTGYIAGSWNTADSIPKVYFTRNGGSTWDSLASPTGTITRIGYVNNPNVAPIMYTVTGKGKEINRIIFNNDSVGYVIGTASLSSGGPTINTVGVNSTTCLPTTSAASTLGAQHATLFWKFSKGQLIDYSITKERLGFAGLPSGTIACNSLYRSTTPSTQSYNTVHIVNDSITLLISNTNNMVMRVYTGRNDSTLNVATNAKDAGRYEILNMTNPPTGFGTIPSANPIFGFSNPRNIVKAANGKIYAPVASPALNPSNKMYTSIDTGRTWREESNLPTGRNYSLFGQQAIDISPSGKFLMGGTGGVMSDSVAGGVWKSNYDLVAGSGYNQIEFADCANGMAVGGSSITVTTDGGKTWIDKNRADFASSFYTIGGFAYPTVGQAYFAVSNGVVYGSTDQGTTLDPLYTNTNYQMRDVAAVGDTVWVAASGAFTVPTASRASAIFRSIDKGLNWTAVTAPFFPGTNNQTLTEIEFPSKLVGYAAGSRDTIWKTTDGGTTWFKLPLPTPGITPQITYSDMQAIDDNTVILTGNGFPRMVVFKTTDGGNTWQDITSNALTLKQESNIFGVMFHDATNGYIAMGNGAILKTTNGGALWTMDYAPSSGFNALGFAPKKVPPAISFQNHKLFAASGNILEYGTTANVNVNFSSTVTNATCTAPSGGSITVAASGGLPPYSYSINGGAYQSSNVFSGLTQGAKTISVKDAFCGLSSSTVNVGFSDNLTLTTIPAVDTTVCANKPVQLTATASAGSTYAWAGAGLSANNIANPVATVNNPVSYTVTASLNGCTRSKVVPVKIWNNPVVSAGPDKTLLIGNQVTLQGSSSNVTQSIAWTPSVGIVTGGNTFFPVVAPTLTTKYTMSVVDLNGCTGSADATVTVIPMCLKVMEAFTPNGDGLNDRWRVTTDAPCTTRIWVSVFNRYGNVVYKNDTYQNNWDGTYEGKAVPDGTYYYVVRYQLIDGTGGSLKGSVTILR